MHIPILAALDNEWTVLCHDRSAHRQFLRWKQEDPALGSVEDLAGLLAVANNRADLEAGDAVLAAWPGAPPPTPSPPRSSSMPCSPGSSG